MSRLSRSWKASIPHIGKVDRCGLRSIDVLRAVAKMDCVREGVMVPGARCIRQKGPEGITRQRVRAVVAVAASVSAGRCVSAARFVLR